VPETLQITVRLGFELGAGVNVAENFAIVPGETVLGPSMLSVNELVTVIEELLDFEVSATLDAVSDTVAGTGRICGAV